MSKLAAEEPSILHCHIGARTHARASRCDCRCSPHLTQIVKRVARRVRLSHRGPRKRAAVLFGAVDGRELVVQLRRRHSCQSVQLSRATVAHLLRLSREGRQHRQRAVQVEAEQSAQAEPGRLSSHSGGSRRRPEIRRQPHGARRVSSGKVLRELGVEAARVALTLLHLLLTYFTYYVLTYLQHYTSSPHGACGSSFSSPGFHFSSYTFLTTTLRPGKSERNTSYRRRAERIRTPRDQLPGATHRFQKYLNPFSTPQLPPLAGKRTLHSPGSRAGGRRAAGRAL